MPFSQWRLLSAVLQHRRLFQLRLSLRLRAWTRPSNLRQSVAINYYNYNYNYNYNHNFNERKTAGWSKIAKANLFGSVRYSGRSSSIKPSCSRAEFIRSTTTEIRWNKNEEARTSPVVSTNRQLPNSLKNWRASLLIGPWGSTAIRANSSCDESPAYLATLFDVANPATAPDYYYCYVLYAIWQQRIHIQKCRIYIVCIKTYRYIKAHKTHVN